MLVGLLSLALTAAPQDPPKVEKRIVGYYV